MPVKVIHPILTETEKAAQIAAIQYALAIFAQMCEERKGANNEDSGLFCADRGAGGSGAAVSHGD